MRDAQASRGTADDEAIWGPGPMLSDDDCLAGFAGFLEGLGVFERIAVGRLAQPRPGDGLPSCWIYGVSSVEASPPEFCPDRVRTFGFECLISVSVDGQADAGELLPLLDSLSNQVADLIAANPPVGCFPDLCELERVDYPAAGRDSTTSAKLAGQVVYLIDSTTGRSETD